MARGLDTVDIAFITSFGLLNLVKFTAWIDKVTEDTAIG
ncbi:MAG: hypothetical protein N4J56_004182 [Chroococcidiopsis sp. SAG 2025]|nr:hypothetical protein [Chroococcidiopsis sp. SAG 2025]